MEPMRRKRALSVPLVRRQLAQRVDIAPNPWRGLGPLGDDVTRTATALAELAVQTSHSPETWPLQVQIAESVVHEFLIATDRARRDGVEHGKWLVAHKLEDYSGMEAQLRDLQMRYDTLEGRLAEAKAALDRSALRDLSNRE